MAALPNGTTYFVATAHGSTKTITAITNANPAVCTSTAHGFADGDIVNITSGWGRINRRSFKVSGSLTNSFELSGLDTSDTAIYPSGSSAGTAREVTTFTQVTKVMSPTTSGGDPKSSTYKFVEDDIEYSLNDGFSAMSLTMDIDDDVSTAGYTALQALTESQADTTGKMRMKNGSYILFGCTVAMNEMPKIAEGQINRLGVVFNFTNKPVRYAS